MSFRLGTRGSKLALAQSGEITDLLRKSGLTEDIEKVIVKTAGDSGHAGMRPREGSFVDEINRLVLEGRLDGGIHSMKDVPVRLPEGLCIAVIPHRMRRADCLISSEYYTKLPEGSTVGTSSARRIAQITRARADLKTEALRGNITTRISKVEGKQLRAAVVALCGLERLGYTGGGGLRIFPLPVEQFVPAAGQGALALVTRTDRLPGDVIRKADHPGTRSEVELERSVLALLNAGCNSPLGVSAQALGRGLHLRAQLLSQDGSFERRVSALIEHPADVAPKLQVFGDEASKIIISGGGIQ